MQATWNEVPQSEIADTLRTLAEYLAAKNIGEAHNALCLEWMETGGLADQIEEMDQGALDSLFGKGDPQDYWPGKFKPTIMRMLEMFHFFVYREELEGKEPAMQALMDRINAFEGFSGMCHLALTKYDHEANDYLSAQPRHPSETLTPCDDPYVDHLNAVNFAYDHLDGQWIPTDKNTVEARMSQGGADDKKGRKNKRMASYKVSIEEGLRRGNIKADVRIELGETYGEDAVTVRMSMNEYQKYIEAKRGLRKIDLSDPESDRPDSTIMGCRISEEYSGFEPGKAAFRGPGGTYVFSGALKPRRSKKITEKMNWLRATGFVSEENVRVSSAFGQIPYVKLSASHVPGGDKDPYVVEDRYWDSCDLHNTIHSTIWEIADLANCGTGESSYRLRKSQSKLSTAWSEVGEDISMPRNDPFKQVAFHFQHTYGLKPSIDSSGNEWSFVFNMSAIPDAQREAIRTEMKGALEQVTQDIERGNSGMGIPAVMPKTTRKPR